MELVLSSSRTPARGERRWVWTRAAPSNRSWKNSKLALGEPVCSYEVRPFCFSLKIFSTSDSFLTDIERVLHGEEDEDVFGFFGAQVLTLGIILYPIFGELRRVRQKDSPLSVG